MATVLDNVAFMRAVDATAAGQTDVTGATIDTHGYEGVLFCLDIGTLTATQVTSMRLQQGTASDGSNMADIAGSKVGPFADTDGQKYAIIEVMRPIKRYVRVIVNRATEDAVINGGVALLYGTRNSPAMQCTTAGGVACSKVLVSPEEGTP